MGPIYAQRANRIWPSTEVRRNPSSPRRGSPPSVAASARRRGVGTELVAVVVHKPRQSATSGYMSISKTIFVGGVDLGLW
jgi:hypothetical protein